MQLAKPRAEHPLGAFLVRGVGVKLTRTVAQQEGHPDGDHPPSDLLVRAEPDEEVDEDLGSGVRLGVLPLVEQQPPKEKGVMRDRGPCCVDNPPGEHVDV